MNYNRIHGHQYKSASSKALEEWFPGRSQDVWSMVARTFPVCLRTEVPKCQTGSSRTIQNFRFFEWLWMKIHNFNQNLLLCSPEAFQLRGGLRRFHSGLATGHGSQHFLGSTADRGAAKHLGWDQVMDDWMGPLQSSWITGWLDDWMTGCTLW